jgi:hypothetical protein
MFVRFRNHGARLNVTLVRTRRVAGKVRSEHVAALGSVPLDGADRFAVRDRTELWRRLHVNVANLPPENQGRLMAAVHARVPLPTEEERGAAALAEAEHDTAFRQTCHASSLEQIENCRTLIAIPEKQIAEQQEGAKREAEHAERATAKAARLANYRET